MESEFCASGAHSAWGTASPSSCGAGGGGGGGGGGLGGALIASLLAAMLDAQALLGDVAAYPPDVQQPLDAYDFVVVGGGSAGAAVAARLSEVPRWKVLLLEAGGDPPLTSEIPPLFHSLQGTDIDWAYTTEPQQHGCLGMREQRCAWPRGKVLGGSSVLNSMLHVRGNRRDFDAWAAAGNAGWGYKDVLPYFKKSEDMRRPALTQGDEDDDYNERFHATGGPLTLDLSDHYPPLVDALLEAAREMGYRVGDINGAIQTGFTLQHAAIRNGTRCSSAKAFLTPARERDTLHVAKYAHVTKVLVDQRTMQAVGVEYIKNGTLRTVKATKEVILSAGSVNSAQLLMLSGVGPREHLETLGIPVVRDLPVGDNLQDHMELLTPTFMFNRSNPQGKDPVKELENTFQYLMHRTGPLAGLDILHFQGFINTKYADLSDDYPDVQYQHIRFAFNDKETTRRVSEVTGFTDEVYEAVFGIPNSKAEIYMPLAVLQRPKSRGTIRLRSKDPLEPPVIDPRYLSHEDDVRVLVEGVRFALRMARTEALGRFEVAPSEEPVPGCAAEPMDSDKYWACAVRHLATTIYHPVGTCKMGPAADAAAVVDPRLRVHGIKGLRVVDASIMPTIVTGNINAAVVMIGEKGADLVKEDWPLGRTN